ncbi:MAG TPA: 6-hydroxymethylpterin diphosphokinase MptE-like protein, partial [Vicinamibacterales bacterium]|nr:6-hydroxymethylpterin diphosphokinase MptE-like protein [Vicinamibacterales bacterium]
MESAPGGATLLWRRGDAWIALNSRRDPVAEAAGWLDSAGVTGDTKTIFVVGAGLGYVLDEIARRSPQALVVAVEPDAGCARALLEHRDVSPLVDAGRFQLLTGPDYAGRAELWRRIDEAPIVLQHPTVSREMPVETSAAREVIAGAIFAARANAAARRAQAGPYLLNTLRNRSRIAAGRDAAALFDCFQGWPAVIVSAGPSLDENLPGLAALQDRALMVATDTALRPMLAAGVRPHLVVALDSSRLNAEHLLDLPDTTGIALVAEGSVHPVGFDAFQDRTFFFRVDDHHPWPWLAANGCSRARLDAWGSVATAAVDLARRAGCDRLIFCGQDLAFTGDRPYCTGATWDRWGVRRTPLPDLPAADIHGCPTTTASHLMSVRNWIVEQSTTDLTRRYLNASGAGILHGGRIELVSLRELAAILPPQPVSPRTLIASVSANGKPVVLPEPSAEVRAEWQSFVGGDAEVFDLQHELTGAHPVRPAGPDATGLHTSVATAVREFQTDRANEGTGLARTLPMRDALRLGATLAAHAPRRILLMNPDAGLNRRLAGVSAPEAEIHAVSLEHHHAAQPSGAFDAVILDVNLTAPAGAALAGAIDRARAVLVDGGLLAITDTSPRVVGAAVRRAVVEATTRHRDLTLRATRHTDMITRLSVLEKRASGHFASVRATQAQTFRSDTTALATLVLSHLRPARVAIVGPTADHWARPFGNAPGVSCEIVDPAHAADVKRPSASRFDVAICLDAAEATSNADDEERLVQCLIGSSDTIVFATPIPGYRVASYPNQRPVAYWVDRFLSHGYVFHDELRPLLEDRPDFTARVFDFDLYAVRRLQSDSARNAVLASPELRQVISAAVARIDDLSVQAG